MQYVDYGSTGLKVSRFGMGCMRFPKIQLNDGKMVIDEDRAIEMIRYAVDHGVNYIDTAYCYEGSEAVVGKALKGSYREKVVLATKLPPWKVNSYDDNDRLLEEELNRLQTDYIDIYLLHNLNKPHFEYAQKSDCIRFVDKAKADGRIRHKGFSFHGSFDEFKERIDNYDWEMCQIQLNYIDINHQAGIKGLKYASEKGLPVVIMEPLRGGSMVQNMPLEVKKVFDSADVKRNPVEWAFRWLYDKPEVSVILSGVSSIEQLKENIKIFDSAQSNVMSESEKEFINEVRKAFESVAYVRCTGCRYCMPCPRGVNIPEVFKHYNDIAMINDVRHAKKMYSSLVVNDGADASKCIGCGRCESLCPQEIHIIEKLKEAHRALTE